MSIAELPPPDDEATTLPNDTAAERACLGAMLRGDRQAIDAVTSTITGPDYHQPRHELIHDAIVHHYSRGTIPDQLLVADRLRDTGDLARAGGIAYLHELTQAAIVTANADYYADIVHETATRRRLMATGNALIAAAWRPGDTTPAQLLDTARTQLDAIPLRPAGVDDDTPGGLDIDTFLGAEDDPYDWLIPDLLERTDRLIVTAGEGHGKSTLLRQLAVQSAAGIHPVTLHPMPPVKVLILDLENSARQSKRKLRPLRLAAGNRLHPGNLIVEIRIEGIDLGQPADVAWLDRLITHHRPDLLISGPIYKMASGDPNDESETKPVVYALDALRAKHGLTLILEAHTKKAEGVDPRKRAKDPVGWSGWRRWPEFGLHLSEDGELTHWRGARDERTWPHQLNRGGQWPFTPSISIVDQRVAQIKDCIRAAGQMPSLREIQKATGIPFKSVQRLLEAHAAEFKAITFWSETESDDDQDGPS